MKSAGVLLCYLAGVLISGMVIFELFRFNFIPALMWMLMAVVYLTGMMLLVDYIEDKGGFDG